MPRGKRTIACFSISFFFVVKFLCFCTFSHVVTASEHKEFRRPAFPSAIIAMSRILKGKTSWVTSHYLVPKSQIRGLFFLWKLWYMDLINWEGQVLMQVPEMSATIEKWVFPCEEQARNSIQGECILKKKIIWFQTKPIAFAVSPHFFVVVVFQFPWL